MEKLAYTVPEWCKARGISRGRFHELEQADLAPRTYAVASKKYISHQADAEWQRRMEAGAAESFRPLPAKNPGKPGRLSRSSA
jgi:hypothetical protein